MMNIITRRITKDDNGISFNMGNNNNVFHNLGYGQIRFKIGGIIMKDITLIVAIFWLVFMIFWLIIVGISTLL